MPEGAGFTVPWATQQAQLADGGTAFTVLCQFIPAMRRNGAYPLTTRPRRVEMPPYFAARLQQDSQPPSTASFSR